MVRKIVIWSNKKTRRGGGSRCGSKEEQTRGHLDPDGQQQPMQSVSRRLEGMIRTVLSCEDVTITTLRSEWQVRVSGEGDFRSLSGVFHRF